ncbi:hypothetical protein KJ068_26775 [bacterium]|nr:hypothetical protein [bacterium]
MNKGFSTLAGIGLGAVLMYLWDPDRGQRRRASILDEARHVLDKTDEAIAKAGQDLRTRARGVATETLAMLDGLESQLDTQEAFADMPDVLSPQPGAASFALQQKRGSSTRRLLARLGGGILLLYGGQRGGFFGKSLGALGMGLALHGINHIEWKRLLGITNGRHASVVEKSASY